MKLTVVSKWKKAVEGELSKLGVRLERKRPDMVFCVGGDGTFLYGEILYPHIPKVLVYHRCSRCKRHDFSPLIEKLRKGQYRILEDLKIVGTVNSDPKKSLVGLNDMNIHYKLPCAIGLEVSVNGRPVSRNLGDGIIVSTPFGSSGYFSSITRRTFKKGIGIAFNNPVKKEKHLVVPESSVIRAKVTKGSGHLASDCNKKIITLKLGDVIEVKRFNRRARIVQLKGQGKKIVI